MMRAIPAGDEEGLEEGEVYAMQTPQGVWVVAVWDGAQGVDFGVGAFLSSEECIASIHEE